MMINVSGLVKHYGNLTALNHIDIQVEKGEIVGLLGPNGSGKTTAIQCMLSLLKYDRGSIELFGEPMTPQRYDLKKRIGVVPQELAFFDELTVWQNIDYFCGLYVINKHIRKGMVDKAITLVGLTDFLTFYPKQLSGGLKRRLNIACGIAHEPELIFLDEPTVAVDPQSRNHILESIKVLNQEGATVIYTTHYMEEVELLCDRILIMDEGQMIAEGTKEALKESIRTGEKLRLELPILTTDDLQTIATLPHVTHADYDAPYLTIQMENINDVMLNLLRFLSDHDIVYRHMKTEEVTLNDVFLEITGKRLRD